MNRIRISVFLFLIFVFSSALAQDLPSVSLDSSNTLTFQDLKFNHLDWLAPKSFIAVHKVDFGRPKGDLLMNIDGVRINMPNSLPISIDGSLKDKFFNLHISAPRVNLGDVFNRLPKNHLLRKAGGIVTHFSMDITGPRDALKISAKWRMHHLQYERFFLKEAEGSIEMVSHKSGNQVFWNGHVSLEDAFVVFQSNVDAMIKVQRIGLVFKDRPLTDFTIAVSQARLISPNLTAALLYANVRNGLLDANLYFFSVDIQTILNFFPKSAALEKIAGDINNLDVYLQGDVRQPKSAGSFHVNKIFDQRFSLVDAPGVFGLDFKSEDENISVNGEIVLNGGEILGPNAVAVNLDVGRMVFLGDPKNPDLDFIAHAQVEDVNIHAGIKGSIRQPDLKLSSDPPRSKNILLLMLATGRSWDSLENSFNQNAIGSDLAADFIDYFIFGGSGNKIAQRFGIRNISVKVDGDTRGINFKKDVSDKAAISYGLEQTKSTDDREPVVVQKVGGEIKLSDTVSLSAEKEIKQEEKTSQSQDRQPVADDKVILKFKKEF